MSSVIVKFLAAYGKPDLSGECDVLFGASEVVVDDHGVVLVFVDSIPISAALSPPPDGILGIYGYRDSLAELKLRRDQARCAGFEYVSIEAEVDVGEIVVGSVTRELLQNRRFANVQRMSVQLQEEIRGSFAQYLIEEGVNFEIDESSAAGRLRDIGQHPELWTRFIDDNPEFSRLECLVIPICESGVVRMVAWLRPNARILSMTYPPEINPCFKYPFGLDFGLEDI